MILRKLWNITKKKSWSMLFIVPMKATFVMPGNCNVPLTESLFVFSRDISTSRYRCVCKSAGIISRCKRQIINIRWIKKTRNQTMATPSVVVDNGTVSPSNIFPMACHSQPPYMYMHTYQYMSVTVALCHDTLLYMMESRLYDSK